MSAYLVNSDTLDLIASAATLYGRDSSGGLYVYLDEQTTPPTQGLELVTTDGGTRYVHVRGGDEDNLVRELWHVHKVSLEARYDDPSSLMHDDLLADTWRPIYDVSTAVIMGALNCYEYQACESDTWRNSFAHQFCQALRRKLCTSIAGDNWEYTRPAGYVQAISLMDMIKP